MGVYLAQLVNGNTEQYFIRKSFYDKQKQCYSFRDIFSLGSNPRNYFNNQDHTCFTFDDSLLDSLVEAGVKNAQDHLEQLLWDFLPGDEKEMILRFKRSSNISLKPITDSEKKEIDSYIHMFDRRRMYYIRFGAVDQARIYRLKDKIYRPLLFKSRDEKEFYFKNMERSLSAHELKKYVYVIFNLQSHFTTLFAPFMPEALDPLLVEEIFLEEICNLNSDGSFWDEKDGSDFLRYHLRRYLIYFFDYGYEEQSFEEEFIRNFKQQHRSFKWPERPGKLEEDEILEVFGESLQDLKKMSRVELTRLFRKKAKEFHPDSGGDSEKFIKLQTSYEVLKKSSLS